MSDQPDKPEDGDSASSESDMPEPELLKADDVRLAEPDVSADAVEPVLETSAEDVRLSEPSLGAAEISEDAAAAASLDEAAAEAELVAREAEEVGTLVGGPRPLEDPAADAAPSGTAAAGGTASDVTDGSADVPGDAADEPIHAADDAADVSSDASVDEDVPAGLASFAASGDEPAWTSQAQDQSRWDALFEAERSSGSADSSETAPAEVSDASEEGPEASQTAIPAPPAADPVGAEQPSVGEQPPDSAAAAAEAEAAPESPWAQPFPTTHPKAPGNPVPPVGGPYGLPPAGADEAPPTRIRARAVGRSSKGANRKKLIILGLIGVVVIALLIFAITSIVNALRADDSDAGSSPSTTPGADGIIAEDISPLELAAGACILGFDSTNVSADVTTVTCTTPHNAQLLATTSLPEDAEFPGEAALNASGDDLCNSVPIDENAASEFENLTLTQVTPTADTWADGDRRIDCFVVTDQGNIVTDTLLAE